MSSLLLGDELGGYRLDEIAGRGGMGVVYRATQVRLERTVALKVIAPELASNPGFRARFQREARLMAAVDHPHVIPVYEADEADGQLFLSMRWIEGADMAEDLAAGGGLDPERAQRLLAQIAGALDAVHAHGLVHGDLKPANVLIERRGAEEHAYLSDFGAGRQMEATATGQWLGTIDYVAPETLRGEAPDARSDRYGLACVVFEALTGAPPFHRDTAWATMWAHGNEPPPSACARRPALPRAVDAVLARGLAKDPEARYPSAERLLQALGDALATGRGAATAAVPDPPRSDPAGTPSVGDGEDPARGSRPARRRGRAVVAALVLILIVAGAATGAIIASSGSKSPARHPPAPATITRTPLGSGSQPIELAADSKGTYVIDEFGQYVDVVDLGGALTRISLPGKPRSLVLDPARKMLWVGLFDRRLVPVSLDSHRALSNGIRLPTVPDLLAVVGDEVVAEQGNPAQLVRVDARSDRLIGKPVVPGGSATSLIAYNGSLLSMNVFPPRLERFDANLRRTGEHPVPAAFPTGMALDSLGALWVTDYDAARVWRLDPSNGTAEGPALAVGRNPTRVATSGNYVWVANTGDETVSVINEQANQPRAVPVSIRGTVGPIAGSHDASGSAWAVSGTQLLELQPTG
jgi:serine/threonine protein kinase